MASSSPPQHLTQPEARPPQGTAAQQPQPLVFVPAGSRLRPPTKTLADATPRPAIFLDRDGVLIEDVHFLRDPQEIRVLPGVVEALHSLQEHFAIIVVTNQSGLARGLFSRDTLEETHQQLTKSLNAGGAIIDAIYSCPHLPNAPVETYRQECHCRKPRPGMLLQAHEEYNLDLTASFVVGDRPRDIAAGLAAGVRGIYVGALHTPLMPEAYGHALDMGEAARMILYHRTGG